MCTPECISSDTTRLSTNLRQFSEKNSVEIGGIVNAFQTFFLRIEESIGPLCVGLTSSSDTSLIDDLVNVIVTSLYRNGLKSQYVHRYDEVPYFIGASLKAEVEKCSRSIFIFEYLKGNSFEMHRNLINFFDDAMTLHLFRESIFLFKTLSEMDLAKLWNNTESSPIKHKYFSFSL